MRISIGQRAYRHSGAALFRSFAEERKESTAIRMNRLKSRRRLVSPATRRVALQSQASRTYFRKGQVSRGLNCRDPDRARPAIPIWRSAPRLSWTPRRCPRWSASRTLDARPMPVHRSPDLAAWRPSVGSSPIHWNHDDSAAPSWTRCSEDAEHRPDPTRIPRSSKGRPLLALNVCWTSCTCWHSYRSRFATTVVSLSRNCYKFGIDWDAEGHFIFDTVHFSN